MTSDKVLTRNLPLKPLNIIPLDAAVPFLKNARFLAKLVRSLNAILINISPENVKASERCI